MKAYSLITILFFTGATLASPLKKFECERSVSGSAPSAKEISETVEADLQRRGFPKSQVKGYAILLTTMLASAAAATYMTASLPSEFQFLSHFLAQVSTLGVYVFGAPIWEPLASKFRMLAFGVKRAGRGEAAPASAELLDLWSRTQENYSLNAQMSRNLVSSYLTTFHQNLSDAFRAMEDGRPEYAADQIALAAVRLRILFRELPPDDRNVAAAIRAAFTNHVRIDEEFFELVRARIEALDEDFQAPESRTYYEAALAAWLGVKSAVSN